jgi:hypothetical protein
MTDRESVESWTRNRKEQTGLIRNNSQKGRVCRGWTRNKVGHRQEQTGLARNNSQKGRVWIRNKAGHRQDNN